MHKSSEGETIQIIIIMDLHVSMSSYFNAIWFKIYSSALQSSMQSGLGELVGFLIPAMGGEVMALVALLKATVTPTCEPRKQNLHQSKTFSQLSYAQ